MAKGEKEQDGREALDTATVQLVLKETKELIRALEGTATSRVVIQSGALQIEVERGGGATVGPIMAPIAAAAGAAAAPSAAPGMMPIVAPIVGVFYRSGSPGARPFVEVGDTVERGQTVGIVE